MTLPGGFILPIALITERQYRYEVKETEEADFDWLMESGADYLLSSMFGGKIIHSETAVTRKDQVVYLIGLYDCIELIGETKTEEIIENYGHEY